MLFASELTRKLMRSADNWATKAQRRRTTGSGRCRYIKNLPRRFKNGFQEGGIAKSQKKRGAA